MERPNNEFTGMEFQCPQCRAYLESYQEACPHCGRQLEDEFCATYRPTIPIAVRIMAGLLLLAVILVPIALVVWRLISEALPPSPGL